MNIKWLDYIFVLRPTLFFPVWTLALAGFWAQQRFAASEELSRSGGWFYIFAIALYSLIMGGIFLVNQIQDVESDRLNNKLYLVANGDVPLHTAWLETILLIVLPCTIMIFLKWQLAVAMVVSFIVLGWFYSCPPFSLKNHPISGALNNLCGGYLVFSFGWMIGSRPGLNMIFYATPYALGLLAVYFFTTLPDLEGDRGAHKITVAVRYKAHAVLLSGLIADILAVSMACATRDWVILVPTVLSCPFFIEAVWSKKVTDVLQTNKFATLFLSLAICIKFPVYFPIILFVFLISKWYYKKRFNIVYPSFRT
jgi:4-hydroxybenzoate polyprenyltransferase